MNKSLTKFFFMKHLIISFFLLGSLFSAYAQNDSINKTPVIRDTTPVTNNSMTNNNSMASDSTGSMNNTMRSDSTASMNNMMRTDSTASMHNTMRTDSTGSMNNTMRTDSTATMNNMATDSSHMNSNNANTQSSVNSSAANNTQINSTNNSNAGMSSVSAGTMTSNWNIQGQPGYASLPVLESYVPEDVVAKVRTKYSSVYDISAVKHTADQVAYTVRYNDNGVFKTEIIGEDGNTVQ